MEKNPLIGASIVAVVLLVLGSLTNVVGYQTVQSSAVNESPLFSVRTQKATNQQQNIITSQYLGKEKGNLLQIPTRDNRTELLKRAIEYISEMDDNTFEQFTELCIQRVRQDNTISNTDFDNIVLMLHQLRTKPETITHSFTSRTNYNLTSNGLVTICFWFPGCIPYFILWSIAFISFMTLYFILSQIPTAISCRSSCICIH